WRPHSSTPRSRRARSWPCESRRSVRTPRAQGRRQETQASGGASKVAREAKRCAAGRRSHGKGNLIVLDGAVREDEHRAHPEAGGRYDPRSSVPPEQGAKRLVCV